MKQWDPRQTLKRIVQEAGSQKAAAAKLQISQPYLSDLMHGRRGFSETMLLKLGLESVIIKSRTA